MSFWAPIRCGIGWHLWSHWEDGPDLEYFYSEEDGKPDAKPYLVRHHQTRRCLLCSKKQVEFTHSSE